MLAAASQMARALVTSVSVVTTVASWQPPSVVTVKSPKSVSPRAIAAAVASPQSPVAAPVPVDGSAGATDAAFVGADVAAAGPLLAPPPPQPAIANPLALATAPAGDREP